jgi:glycosyltransferase involved in cell wall biosynthesis
MITLKHLEGPGYVGRYHHLVEKLSQNFDIYLFCARQPWKERDRDASAWKADEYVEELIYGYPIPSKNPYLNELFNTPFNALQLRKIIEHHDIEVVLNGSSVPLGYITPLWKKGRPVIFDLADYMPETSRGKGNLSYRKLTNWPLEKGIKHFQDKSLERPDLVTANTQMLVEYARNHSKGTPVELISNAVDTTVFKPTENTIREQYEIGDAYLFGFGGTIGEGASFPELIRGFEDMKESTSEPVRLMLVGHGSAFDSIKANVSEKDLDDSVTMTGSIAYTDLPEYYSAFDVGVIPRPDRFESHVCRNLKMFEYLACGTPVLCSPIQEIMNHVYPPEDDPEYISYVDFPDEFAEQGLQFARASREPTMGEIARNAVVGAYDWSIVGEEMTDLIHSRFGLD